MKTYAYGFPRLGKDRDFKKAVEGFWNGSLPEHDLFVELDTLQNQINRLYATHVDASPDGEMTLYDPMLDTAVLCGIFSPQSVDDYYALCRGKSALEMTKWFNTNYHYLITDFNEVPNTAFKLNFDHFSLRYKQGAFPSVIGPFTFLKLSKGIARGEFGDLFLELVGVYRKLLARVGSIQIEEPAFVLDVTKDEIALIQEGYSSISEYETNITLMTYYDCVDWIEDLVSLPVSAIGLDFIRGRDNYEYVCKNGFPEDKNLIAGIVDGRNIWRADVRRSVEELRRLGGTVNNLMISNAAPLSHLPVSLAGEEVLDAELRDTLSFAEEKLKEILLIAQCFNGREISEDAPSDAYGKNIGVQNRVKSLTADDFVKPAPLEERREMHDTELHLPLFPTTTIGSYPQTAEVRKKRADFRSGRLSPDEYGQYVRGEIDKLIAFQEKLGLDVLVHGEFERTDMVEFFAQNLDGIATTQAGWVLSYGTRVYRPPIIFGDVSRPKPMTLDEITYAQTRTKKPVKGMLTGAVTIIAWSFCREDIPVAEIAYQIGLSLKDEIRDYENAGIKIVQVDEPAFREKAPIKKREWPDYFDWAVRSFNLTTNTDPKTQIHTHMCYSEFGEIIEYINRMDCDVITIEASRSRGDILESFETVDFKRQIGLGVWDIHSPAVPTTEKMMDIVERSLRKIPKENFWINPDCGLKTRDWPETGESLKNLVTVAHTLRE